MSKRHDQSRLSLPPCRTNRNLGYTSLSSLGLSYELVPPYLNNVSTICSLVPSGVLGPFDELPCSLLPFTDVWSWIRWGWLISLGFISVCLPISTSFYSANLYFLSCGIFRRYLLFFILFFTFLPLFFVFSFPLRSLLVWRLWQYTEIGSRCSFQRLVSALPKLFPDAAILRDRHLLLPVRCVGYPGRISGGYECRLHLVGTLGLLLEWNKKRWGINWYLSVYIYFHIPCISKC